MMAAVSILIFFEVLMMFVGMGVYEGLRTNNTLLTFVSLVVGCIVCGVTYYLLMQTDDEFDSGD